MSKKNPLQHVKEEHGGKEKLVDKVMGLIDRGEEEADILRKRLLAASNKKLLRLAEMGEHMKSEYGSADKLAGAVATAMGRAKDNDYVKRLSAYTPGRLLDMATTLKRRAEAATRTRPVVEKAKEAVKAVKGVAKTAATRAKAATGAARAAATKAAGKARTAVKKATGTAKKPTSKKVKRS